MRYISADEIAEAFEADRNHISHDQIAGHLRISVSELRNVLNLPPLKRPDPEAGCDLWRVVEAERQL